MNREDKECAMSTDRWLFVVKEGGWRGEKGWAAVRKPVKSGLQKADCWLLVAKMANTWHEENGQRKEEKWVQISLGYLHSKVGEG